MKKLLGLSLIAAALIAALATAQVPGGLWRFGTTGAYNAQVGNCVSILAMNSSGQTGTDSGTPCTPVVLTTAYTNATIAYTAVAALPAVQGSLTLKGSCTLIWESSSASGTPTFAVQASAAPTDLWVLATNTSGTAAAPTYTTITTTTQTAVTGALTAAAGSTAYKLSLDFALQTASATPVTLTVYAESNSTSYTITVEPGSSCQWVP